MKAINKWFNPVMLFVILFPFVQYFGSGVQQVVGDTTDNAPIAATGRDITMLPGSDSLKTASDGNGQQVKTILDSVSGPSGRVNIGDQIKLTYTWSIPDALRKNMQPGDYFKFKLPVSMDVTNLAPMAIMDASGDGQQIGQMTFTADGTGTLVFTNLPYANMHGNLYVAGRAADKNNDGTNGASIPFVANGDSALPPITVNGGSNLTKSVAGNQAVTYDDKAKTATIAWDITVNGDGGTLQSTEAGAKAAQLTEDMPAGTTSYDYSVTAESLNPDGSYAPDPASAALVVQTGGDKKDGSKPATFGVKENSADRFTFHYTTTVPYAELKMQKDDKSGSLVATNTQNVTNTAKLTNNGQSVPDATANVTVGYAAHLQKVSAAPDAKTGLIKWTINLVPTRKDNLGPLPAGASFTDTMANGQQLLDASSQPITGNDVAKQLGANADLVTVTPKGADKFTFTAKQALTDPVTLTYYTKPQGDDNAFDQNTNSVDWNGTTVVVPPTKPSQNNNDGGNGQPTQPAKPSINKQATKSRHELIDGKDTLVNDWTITANPEHALLHKLVITDTMASGLTFNDAKFTVTADNGGTGNTTLVADKDYTLTPNADKHGFTLDLTNWGTQDDHAKSKVTVNYQTIQSSTKDDANSVAFTSDNGDGKKDNVTPGNVDNFGGNKTLTSDIGLGTVSIKDAFNGEHVLLPSDGMMVDPIPDGLQPIDANGNPTTDASKMGITAKTDDGQAANLHYQFVTSITPDLLKQINANALKPYTAADFKNGALIATGFDQYPNQGFTLNYNTKLMNTDTKLPQAITAHMLLVDSTYGFKDVQGSTNLYNDKDMLTKTGTLLAEDGHTAIKTTDAAAQTAKHAAYEVVLHPNKAAFTLKDNAITDTFGKNVIFDDKELSPDTYQGTDTFPDYFTVAYQDNATQPFKEVPLTDATTNNNSTIATPTYSVKRMETGFVITMHGAISKPVLIRYTTAIRHFDEDILSGSFAPDNTVQLTGNYNSKPVSTTFNKITLPFGGGSGTGDLASLTVTKTDTHGTRPSTFTTKTRTTRLLVNSRPAQMGPQPKTT